MLKSLLLKEQSLFYNDNLIKLNRYLTKLNILSFKDDYKIKNFLNLKINNLTNFRK